MNEPYVPFPVGTVRGPYYTSHGFESRVQFLVNGPGGWVPFMGKPIETGQVQNRALKYAEDLVPVVEVPLGHS